MSDTAVTDSGIAELTGIESLRVQKLDNLKITSRVGKYLAKMKNIERLSFNGTQIDDSCLDPPECISGLRQLGLAWTNTTATRIAALKAARPDVQINWRPRD